MKQILFGSFLAAAFCMISCAGIPVDTPKEPDPVEQLSDGSEERLAPIEIEGRIDFTDSRYAELWNSSPLEGHPRFFATVPRMANRDDEYDLCLRMASEQLSRFIASRVKARYAEKSAGGNFGQLEEVDVTFDKELGSEYIKELKAIAYYQDREASYLLVEYPAMDLPAVSVDSSLVDGLPVWLTALPDVPDHLSGIGVVKRYRYVAESIFQADKRALASIARQQSIQVQTKQLAYENSSGMAGVKDLKLESTDTLLEGAYIAARWRSEDGSTYYSLALYPQ